MAVSPHEIQGGIPENKDCVDCHTSHQSMDIPPGSSRITIADTPLIAKSNNIQSFEVTNVVGNITLISSLGQNWYQQGIKGPDGYGTNVNDKSWGWTFFDENQSGGFILPNMNMTQRENIYVLLLDDGNNSNPISGAVVVANVTYWKYDGVSYVSAIKSIILNESRKGFYSGIFDFNGGTTYKTEGNMCSGCHIGMFHGTDTKIGYFPGNYSVSIKADANGKINFSNTNFEVTPWGCESCHGSGNRHSAQADMDSACYLCHGINDLTDMGDAGNPHQNTAHINIQCTDCHTNKSLDPLTFGGVTFGGVSGKIPFYNNTTIQLNKGKHSTMSCIDCHNTLTLPGPVGGYGSYTVEGIVNSYDPSFASIGQLQDYYIVNVESLDQLAISLDWNSTANLGFYIFPPDFNPNDGMRPPYYDGATPANKPELFISSTPQAGKWILAVYGYDLRYNFPTFNLKGGVLQSPINYTLSSTHPIQKKDLPSTPECNNCHYSGASGKANTTHEIPDWNPGFAHVDTNGDGTLDIQCRMCHDSMHDIGIKKCQNCHTKAPINHPVLPNPGFNQYNPTQCLTCHGDPHRITGGTNCIACHSPGDVNISLFGKHAIINDSNGAGNVTNDDCWTCHFQKDMNRSNVYLCGSCHSNHTGIVRITNESLVMSGFMHDGTECRTCHAPIVSGYHLNGSVGPLGTVEKILRKMLNP